jgi:hypothetical protein
MNDSVQVMRRRALLRLGFLGGVWSLFGCGSEGQGTVTPTVKQGNKSRLESLQEKAEMLKNKASKPSKK